MHEGKINDLDDALIRQTYAELTAGAATGWGSSWKKFGKDLDKDKTALKLMGNLWKFSGAKTFAELKAFNAELVKNGKIRSWPEFKKAVEKLGLQFNKNWLQAEYQTARQAAGHARHWVEFQKDKDIFPRLKYVTVGDARVRDDHRKLDGIVKPIDDPFWDKFYPPNGWRCRCYVKQTDEPESDEGSFTTPKIGKEFELNVGKSGQIYNYEHPYFAAFNKNPDFEKRIKESGPYQEVYKSSSGAVVEASVFADIADYDENLNTAKVLADNNIPVKIRPHILSNGVKNPEYEMEKKLADRKELRGKNVKTILSKAKKQGAKIVVIVPTGTELSEQRIIERIRGHVQQWHKNVFSRIILVREGKIIDVLK